MICGRLWFEAIVDFGHSLCAFGAPAFPGAEFGCWFCLHTARRLRPLLPRHNLLSESVRANACVRVCC